jgi:hypothetical protein
MPAFAEKIPVKIVPNQIISTHHDEVEVGDIIKFRVLRDVFCGKDVLISKDAPVYGKVDYVHENGFGSDGAEIIFKTFYLKDNNGNKIISNTNLSIDGTEEMTQKLINSNWKNRIKMTPIYIGHYFRGGEILLTPSDTRRIYNIFIEK